jgi:hypothetical protein
MRKETGDKAKANGHQHKEMLREIQAKERRQLGWRPNRWSHMVVQIRNAPYAFTISSTEKWCIGSTATICSTKNVGTTSCYRRMQYMDAPIAVDHRTQSPSSLTSAMETWLRQGE